jgi:hypothetical protein
VNATKHRIRDQPIREVGPVADLVTAATGGEQPVGFFRERLERLCERCAGDRVGADPVRAAVAADAVMGVLWPLGAPSLRWWANPAGRVVAAWSSRPPRQVITPATAAQLLDCAKEDVAHLVRLGRLTRSPGSGISFMPLRELLRASRADPGAVELEQARARRPG